MIILSANDIPHKTFPQKPSTQEPPTMQLNYRGGAYEAASPAIEAMEMHDTATFLGKRYPRRRFSVAHQSPPPEALLYRGMPYSR
jgi:hypothetical protein